MRGEKMSPISADVTKATNSIDQNTAAIERNTSVINSRVRPTTVAGVAGSKNGSNVAPILSSGATKEEIENYQR